MLYSLKKETGHERPKDKSTNKKNYEIIPTPWYESTTPHLSHSPIIQNNNTMDTEFQVQMREFYQLNPTKTQLNLTKTPLNS